MVDVPSLGEKRTAWEAARLMLIDQKAAQYRQVIAKANANIERLSGPSEFDEFLTAIKAAEDAAEAE
jgi:hypothetical protein